MSKRKIILIGVVLVVIAIIAFTFFSFYKPTNTTTNGGGTNFFSSFFPFGKNNNTNTGNQTNPANVSGYTQNTTAPSKELLKKISSMPIAGYGVFMKERFKEVAVAGSDLVPPAKGDLGGLDSNSNPSLTLPLSGAGNSKDLKTSTTKTPTAPTAPLTEFVPSLRYVEKATGNIYQTFADTINEQKFSITVIPEVYDAYFGDSANSIAMRYLKPDGKTIETFAGSTPKEILGGDSSSNEIKGGFLPENITDISVSPDSSSIFYLFNSGDSTIGTTALASGDKKNQIFSSSFNEWLSQWPNNRMITLTTKPSFSFPGFMYGIDPNTKKINKILSGINGLTTLTSPSGKLVLYNDNNLSLKIFNTDTQDSISIGIKTMPEKCTWNKSSTMLYCAVPKYVSGSNYPDPWYQGEMSFSDNIWKLNVANGSATNIADPTSFSGGDDIDGIKLSLDDNENYLFFVNKKDSYLWELQLK